MKLFRCLLCVLAALLNFARADQEFMWGVTGAHGSASSLYAINPTNGEVIGRIGATGANALAGIAVHPSTGVLYAANGAAAPTGLFVLNKQTGVASLVGSSGKVVPAMTFNAAGVLYAWDRVGAKLMTLDLMTGSATTIGGDVAASGVGLVFAPNGTLYLKNASQLYTLNPATGLKITGPLMLGGGAVILENLLAFNAAGTMLTGRREGNGTNVYAVNTTTGATTLQFSIPLEITGFTFDSTPPPTFRVKGRKRVKTDKSRYKLEGNATSLVPLTVSTKGKSTKAEAGKWKLTVKLKPGRNKVKLLCDDGLGQTKQLRVTIVRN